MTVFKLFILLHLAISIACGQAGNINPNKIEKGSNLKISIKGMPTVERSQVNGNYHVVASGKIKLPLTGALIMVNGLTNDQLKRKIETMYKEPVIEVIVNRRDAPRQATLSIGGNVKKSGPIRWR